MEKSRMVVETERKKHNGLESYLYLYLYPNPYPTISTKAQLTAICGGKGDAEARGRRSRVTSRIVSGSKFHQFHLLDLAE